MKVIGKPEGRTDGRWKLQLVKMKKGDCFAAPIIKEQAIRRAAFNLKKKVSIHKMIVVWKI